MHRLPDLDVPALAVPGGVLRVAGQHAQRGEATGAQAEHRGAVEGVDADEPLPLARGQPRHPLGVVGGVEGGPGEVGVRVVGVVDDEQPVCGGLDVVLDAVAARGDHPPPPLRLVRGQQVHLGGGLRPQPEHQPAFVAGGADPHPEPLVVLLVDQHVAGGVGPDAVPPQLVGAPGVVEPGVEDEGAVAAELAAVPDAGDRVVEDLARGDVAHDEVEPLVAGGVGGEGDEAVVGADGERADGEELAVAGLDVAVDDDLLALGRPALGVGPDRGVGERAPARARGTGGPRWSARSTTRARWPPAPTGRSP